MPLHDIEQTVFTVNLKLLIMRMLWSCLEATWQVVACMHAALHGSACKLTHATHLACSVAVVQVISGGTESCRWLAA